MVVKADLHCSLSEGFARGDIITFFNKKGLAYAYKLREYKVSPEKIILLQNLMCVNTSS